MNTQPELSFFCELEAKALKKLFEDRFVFDDLLALKAGVALGILDFSAERADVIKKFNRLGIPVTAWLLLPKDEGYWFNLENYPQAIKRYEEFKQWTAKNGLKWQRIGLDIEPDINQVSEAYAGKSQIVVKALKRLKDPKIYQEVVMAYESLVEQIHQDGYRVEAYHFPLIVDDRKANSNVLQRLIGLVDVPVDRDVLMLYSSFSRPQGHAQLLSYASQADGIGIGNTGGGVQIENWDEAPYLTWDEFALDLRIAWQSGKPVYIFSLEGCVWQGFLPRLTTFDWSAKVDLPNPSGVNVRRKGLQGVLWLAQRPIALVIGLAGLIGGVMMLKRSHKQQRIE